MLTQTMEKSNIQPDKIIVGQEYALTVNADKVSGNLQKDIETYLIIVKAITNHKTDLLLLPELSKTGRLHYHGKIKFNDEKSIGEFYLILHRNRSAYNCLIKPIEDMKKWEEYIIKQRFFMKPLMEAHCLKYRLGTPLKAQGEPLSSPRGGLGGRSGLGRGQREPGAPGPQDAAASGGEDSPCELED